MAPGRSHTSFNWPNTLNWFIWMPFPNWPVASIPPLLTSTSHLLSSQETTRKPHLYFLLLPWFRCLLSFYTRVDVKTPGTSFLRYLTWHQQANGEWTSSPQQGAGAATGISTSEPKEDIQILLLQEVFLMLGGWWHPWQSSLAFGVSWDCTPSAGLRHCRAVCGNPSGLCHSSQHPCTPGFNRVAMSSQPNQLLPAVAKDRYVPSSCDCFWKKLHYTYKSLIQKHCISCALTMFYLGANYHNQYTISVVLINLF